MIMCAAKMIDKFVPLEALFRRESASVDNPIFRLQYRFTVPLLLVFTLMVSTKQFFGEPIHCIGHTKDDKDALNSFCWINGTYTVKKLTSKHPNYQLSDYKGRLAPGTGSHIEGEDEEVHHIYYQWVSFILLLQALLFYFPKALWQVWEGGRIANLTSELDKPLSNTKWNSEKKDSLVNYLIETNLYTQNFHALYYGICELLNFANCIGQFIFLNKFFGGSYFDYGTAVAAFQYDPRNPHLDNPMDMVFPKLTKCRFHFYGSSGTIQQLDLLCVLPLNVVNEKIFLFIWFWLAILTVLTCLALIYRILIFCFPFLRAYTLMAQARLVPKIHIINIVNKFNIGDWFVLHLMGKNLNPIIFKDLVIEIGKELQRRPIYL